MISALLLSLILLLLCGVSTARAQSLTLDITPLSQTIAAGDTATFTARLTNISAAGVSLLGSQGSFNFLGIGTPPPNALEWNDTDFFNNLPIELAAGDFYEANLFAVSLAGALPGDYNGIYTVDGETGNPASAVSASDSVVVTVTSSNNTVAPEPGSLLLLLLGGGAAAAITTRARSRTRGAA